mmetsp:Transcript_7082/g.7068  ORF Transcript_7082/g.7068 Transcript_7082/m.7068 type:complete len:220 (+) Transcript_7082:207-866(+)
MPLKTFDVTKTATVIAEPLTPEGFAPYGGVISADHQIKNVKSSAANYGTAIKIHKVAPIVNNFKDCPSGKEATANWNIFRCSFPNKSVTSGSHGEQIYRARVLERHPFSTQTFIPMGLVQSKSSYLVIVAKNDKSTSPINLPDLSSVKAFICKGNQSITYGQGIWHAPMVVIDEASPYIDFAVFIHENGVDNEDVEECYFEPGFDIEYHREDTKSMAKL